MLQANGGLCLSSKLAVTRTSITLTSIQTLTVGIREKFHISEKGGDLNNIPTSLLNSKTLV